MTNTPGPYTAFIKKEAESLNKQFGRTYQQDNVLAPVTEPQVSDCNQAVQRVYDTRENFVSAANRYFTRCTVLMAAILTAVKFILELKSQSQQSLLLFCIGLVSLAICYLVFKNKSLMKSVYYLYSSSAVTATIKSKASGIGQHSWFDAVDRDAGELDSEAENHQQGSDRLRVFGVFGIPAYGIVFDPPSSDRPRESLANRWASKRENLLDTNVRMNDAMMTLFFVLGLTIIFWSGFGLLTNQSAKGEKTPLSIKLEVSANHENVAAQIVSGLLSDSGLIDSEGEIDLKAGSDNN